MSRDRLTPVTLGVYRVDGLPGWWQPVGADGDLIVVDRVEASSVYRRPMGSTKRAALGTEG